MLSRLFTWTFYAVVFFLLGVWVGGFSPGIRALMRGGGEAALVVYQDIRQWALNSISERPQPTPTPAQATPADLLRAARSAFDRGDVSEAISIYRERLGADPGDLDARGELGNVLTSAGRLGEAGEAYYEVALRLARAGEAKRAQALEAAIRRHDTALADKLAAELKSLKAGG